MRDIQRTAAILREKSGAKNIEDIRKRDWPDGETTEEPSVTVEPTNVEVLQKQTLRLRKPMSR